jgi:hypothetical protein
VREGYDDVDVADREVEAFAQARQTAEHIFTEDDFRPFLCCASNLVGYPEQHRALLEHDSCT